MELQKKLIATDILSLFVILVGCLVMFGWFSHSVTLMQLSTSFAPMQFNTALCFVLCGFSLILLNHNQAKPIPILIFPVLLISIITLLTYIFDQKSTIDELLIKAFISTNQRYPGRMAPNAALSFFMFGLSVLLISHYHTLSNSLLKSNLAINYFVISIGSLAIIGYVSNLETNFGVGQLTKMAFHTAVCFIGLSLGLIIYLKLQRSLTYPTILTLLVPFILFNISFLGWQGTKHYQEENLNIILQQATDNISNYIQLSMRERASAFERISYLWVQHKQGISQEEWQADVAHYIKDQAGYVAIEWLDSNFVIRWVEPQKGNNHMIGYNLYQDARIRIEIDASLHSKSLRLSPRLDLIQGGTGVIFFSPLYKDEQFSGLMVGVINTSILFNELIGRLGKTDFLITIKDKVGIIYSNHKDLNLINGNSIDQWTHSIVLNMYGQKWQLIIQPSPILYHQILSPILPWVTLVIGCFIALLSGILIASFFSIKKLQVIAGDTNERLNGIIEGSNELIAAIDLNYNIIALNKSYQSAIYRIFHVNLVPGMNLSVLYPLMTEENQNAVKHLWEKAFIGKPFTVIQSFFEKKYSNLQFEIRYSPIFNTQGQLIGACHIASNITSRLKNEKQIKEDREKLRNLVNILEEKNTYFHLLKEFTNILHSHTNLNQANETISIYTKKLFPNTAGIFYLYNSKEQVIEPRAIWNKPIAQVNVFTPSDCLGFSQEHSYYISNTKKDLVCNHIHQSTSPESYICVPLLANNKILGLMYIEFSNPTDNTEIGFIQLYCEQIALIIYNLKLQDSLRMESIQDPLTGLYNRRYFEEQIQQAIQKAKRYDDSFSIMLLDIDHFKLINDQYGHLAGDKVLQYLSNKMKLFFRESDIIGRWGGEEFIIILKEISAEDLLNKAEKLRQDVESFTIDLDRATTSLTISIGIAMFTNQTDKEQIINNADKALYKAKNEGRNKVVLYSPQDQF